MLKAIFNTKSNYKNSNGIPLEIVEQIDTRISVKMPSYGFNEDKTPIGDTYITADFHIKELVKFSK